MLADCIHAAQHCGLRWTTPLSTGQNIVLAGIWHGRRVVIKARLQNYRLRLLKEQRWLERALQAGISCPEPIAMLEEPDWLFLVLCELRPLRMHPWLPVDWHRAVAPLGTLQLDQPGWGPLRADDRPRWQQADHALAWYRDQAAQLGRDDLGRELNATWRAREAGLIHGDLHPGNRIGRHICDWEQVARADPLEDACRLALATAHHPRACISAWGGDPSGVRARGALLRSVIESAAHPGPRQVQATRLLRLL